MKPLIRPLSSKVSDSLSVTTLSGFALELDYPHNHFAHFPSMNSAASFRNARPGSAGRQNLNCLWPYWTPADGQRPPSNSGNGHSIVHLSGQKDSGFSPSSPGRHCTNKQGFVTIPGIENIDPFLLALRFYGFDLWMSRYAETGKRFVKRHCLTKVMFYFALCMINLQMCSHVLTNGHALLTGRRNFYSSLDDVRTFILKFTMTFAVDFWYLRSRSQSGMTHLIAINYLRGNSPSRLRSIATRWMVVMLFITLLHWAISQYWLSSMSLLEQRKWLGILQWAVSIKWFTEQGEGESLLSTSILRTLATVDSFVYRMFIYGSRFGAMCAYCLLSTLLTECIAQVNRILADQLDNEYHYHHHYCRRSASKPCTDGPFPNCSVKFNLELFKEQFNIIWRMHTEIETCFGPLNFIWFGSLFVVTCIDIFFLAWKAGTEWFKVWSLLEFTSMVVLWFPHLLVAYYASRVCIESRRMKLNLKELCRQDEEVREILVSSMFYPRMKPTLAGIVQLDIGFFLSFIVTLVTFSVMLIQLNPDAAAKVG